MGIAGLWDVLGEGQIIHVAEYAANFYKQHQRPLRIAVDEACWRFNNLTNEQVRDIRTGEPAANPIEKTILYRILRLRRRNIDLIFVTDGPGKPWGKRDSRKGGLVKHEKVALLHKLFTLLKVPFHQALGEAEAECARMQQLGLVDAVWSDDGDAFMFGARLLIKPHKIDGKPVQGIISVYSADDIEKEHDLDSKSLVVFALLAGGDYAVSGLKGCGPTAARILAKRVYGLGDIATTISAAGISQFQSALQYTMEITKKRADIPPSFPDFKALENYRNPKVSNDYSLTSLRALRNGWPSFLSIDQVKLRDELRDSYNFPTRDFIKHIAPILLIQTLIRGKSHHNAEFNIVRKRQIKERPGKEVKITFSPLPVLGINISSQPQEEDWKKWDDSKTGEPYDPTQDIECEVLECFLHAGLTDSATANLQPPARGKAKRKQQEEDDETATYPKPKKRKTAIPDESSQPSSSQTAKPKKQSKKKSTASTEEPSKPTEQPKPKPKKRKKDSVKEAPQEDPEPPRPQFRHIQSNPSFQAALAMEVQAEEALSSSQPLARTRKTSCQPSAPPRTNFSQPPPPRPVPQVFNPPPKPTAPKPTPTFKAAAHIATPPRIDLSESLKLGEEIPPDVLRELRRAKWQAAAGPPSSLPQPEEKPAQTRPAWKTPGVEIIDLT